MRWNIHPGKILREEFMKPLKLSSRKSDNLLDVPAPRINDIVLERRGITANTAIKLAQHFGTTPKYRMNLQVSYELREEQSKFAKGA